MHDIIVNGKSYGAWDEDGLPMLSEKIGVSVDEIKAQNEKRVAGEKAAAVIDENVKARVGNQKKILGIVADCSLLGLVVAGALLRTATQEQKEAIEPILANILGDGAQGKIDALIDRFDAGEIISPAQLKGLDSVLQDAEMCAGGMSEVLIEFTGAKRPKRRPKKAKPKPAAPVKKDEVSEDDNNADTGDNPVTEVLG